MKYGMLLKKSVNRLLALVVAGSVGLTLAGCGKKEEERVDPVKEWVYVPEFVTIEEDNVSYYDMSYSGDSLYYVNYEWDPEAGSSTQSLCRYSLADGKVTKTPLDWGEDRTNNSDIRNKVFDSEGQMYAVVVTYNFDETTYESNSTYALARFGADGKLNFYLDITEALSEGSSDNRLYINNMAIDGKGRIYMADNSTVWLFEGDGTYRGSVPVGSGTGSYLQAMGADSEGNVYVVNMSYTEEGSRNELIEIDFDHKKTGESYAGFPRGYSEGVTPGAEAGTFLVNDGSTVYEYRLADQTKTELFSWLDSDINGSSVRGMGVLGDGRILAIIEDWENEDNGIALLTKTKGSEVERKETILIGTIGSGSSLQSAAVRFNRSSDKYHISVKEYMDYDNYSESTYQDAITNLHNDLLSKSSCPDIIDLRGLNIKQLASKGLLEDLGQYLDKSSVLKREDFVESVLNAYTYDGVLTCIPTSFELATVVGKKSDLGEKEGWTLAEMEDYVKKHSGAEVFDQFSQTDMLRYMVMFNEDAFIDWSEKKCNFNSEEFKSLLNFVSSFPQENVYDPDRLSTPTRIQRGEVLLDVAELYDFDNIQIYYEIFGGDINCIGFPTVDGSSGTMLASDGSYAITSKAARKEGAWEFLEKYIENYSDRYSFGFPSLKSKLDEMAKDAVTVQYWTDEKTGKPILDDEGNPIEIGVGGGISYGDGWSYEYRRPTQEEVDLLYHLLSGAKAVSYSDDEILKIITEEAAAFFQGGKNVDEVVNIIQSRVQIYVDTNS